MEYAYLYPYLVGLLAMCTTLLVRLHSMGGGIEGLNQNYFAAKEAENRKARRARFRGGGRLFKPPSTKMRRGMVEDPRFATVVKGGAATEWFKPFGDRPDQPPIGIYPQREPDYTFKTHTDLLAFCRSSAGSSGLPPASENPITHKRFSQPLLVKLGTEWALPAVEGSLANRATRRPWLWAADRMFHTKPYQHTEESHGLRNYEGGSACHSIISKAFTMVQGLVMVVDPKRDTEMDVVRDAILVAAAELNDHLRVYTTTLDTSRSTTFPSGDAFGYFNLIIMFTRSGPMVHHCQQMGKRCIKFNLPYLADCGRSLAILRLLPGLLGPTSGVYFTANANDVSDAILRPLIYQAQHGMLAGSISIYNLNPVSLGCAFTVGGYLALNRVGISTAISLFRNIYGFDEAVLWHLPFASFRSQSRSTMFYDCGADRETHLMTYLSLSDHAPVEKWLPYAGSAEGIPEPQGTTIRIHEYRRTPRMTPYKWAQVRPVSESGLGPTTYTGGRPVTWAWDGGVARPPAMDPRCEREMVASDGHPIAKDLYYRENETNNGFRGRTVGASTMYLCQPDEVADWTCRRWRSANPEVKHAINELVVTTAHVVEAIGRDIFYYVTAADQAYYEGFVNNAWGNRQPHMSQDWAIIYTPCELDRTPVIDYERRIVRIPVPAINESYRSLMYWRLVPALCPLSGTRFVIGNARGGFFLHGRHYGLAKDPYVQQVSFSQWGPGPVCNGANAMEMGYLLPVQDQVEALFTRFAHCYGPDELFFLQFDPLFVSAGAGNTREAQPSLMMQFPWRALAMQGEDGSWFSPTFYFDKVSREELIAVRYISRNPDHFGDRFQYHTPAPIEVDVRRAITRSREIHALTLKETTHTVPDFKTGDLFECEYPVDIDYDMVKASYRKAHEHTPPSRYYGRESKDEDLLVIVTFGSYGDRVPVLAWARHLAASGVMVLVIHYLNKEDGLRCLANAENNQALRNMDWVLSCRAFVSTLPGRVYAPIAVADGLCTTYSLAPYHAEAKPIRAGTGQSWLDSLVSLTYANTPPDVTIGYFRGYRGAPRSADGVHPLPNEGAGALRSLWQGRKLVGPTYYTAGSSSSKPASGFIPPEAIPLPQGDHVALLREAKALYCPGGEGIVATAKSVGCPVYTWSKALDRERFSGFTIERVHRGNPADDAWYAITIQGNWDYVQFMLSHGHYYDILLALIDRYVTAHRLWQLLWYARLVRRLGSHITIQPTVLGTIAGSAGLHRWPVAAMLIGSFLALFERWAYAEFRTGLISRFVTPVSRVIMWNLTSPMFGLVESAFGIVPALISARAFEHVAKQIRLCLHRLGSFILADYNPGLKDFQHDVIYLELTGTWWRGLPIIHMELVNPSANIRLEGFPDWDKGYGPGAPWKYRISEWRPSLSKWRWYIRTPITPTDLIQRASEGTWIYSFANTCQTLSMAPIRGHPMHYLTLGLAIGVGITWVSSFGIWVGGIALVIANVYDDMVEAVYTIPFADTLARRPGTADWVFGAVAPKWADLWVDYIRVLGIKW